MEEKRKDGCFTVEDIAEASSHVKEFFTPPPRGASTLRIYGGIALCVASSTEQTHQLFICLRDE